MAKRRKEGFSGREKAAILLVILGPEISAQVFKHLEDTEVEQLTLEIANLPTIPPEVKNEIIHEFQHLLVAQEFMAKGGVNYAKELLEKAFGPEKAKEILSKLTAQLQVRPFEFVRKTDPLQLLSVIQGEHPQTIALILAYLSPEQAASVLSGLPPELQVDVARRLATMDRTSPDVIREVERVLERKLSTFVSQDFTMVGGIDALVEILNRSDRGTEKNILEALEEQDPELAEEVKRKLFVFEDVVLLDDRALQRVLREVDMKDLALALKGASEEVREKFFKNMSKRAAQMLKEDMEYMGPVRVRDVEDAQQRIVNIIRQLEEAGEIVIARGGEEELIV